MIYDIENIICIYCNTKLKFFSQSNKSQKYKCDCSKICFTSETLAYYPSMYIIDIDLLFTDKSIRVHTNNKDLYDIIIEEINNIDYQNLYSLSEFYNYIKKYLIAYEKNLVFL